MHTHIHTYTHTYTHKYCRGNIRMPDAVDADRNTIRIMSHHAL